MRIAFLVGRFPSHSETFVLNQITGLLKRGHDVDVYARKPDDGAPSPGIHTRYFPECVTYRTMPGNAMLRALKAMGLTARGLARRPAAVLGALNVFRYG